MSAERFPFHRNRKLENDSTFPSSVHLWWQPLPRLSSEHQPLLRSQSCTPAISTRPSALYLCSDALPLVTPPCTTPLQADRSTWTFPCQHISSAVSFVFFFVFLNKTFMYFFLINPLSWGCWQSTYWILFQAVLSHQSYLWASHS